MGIQTKYSKSFHSSLMDLFIFIQVQILEFVPCQDFCLQDFFSCKALCRILFLRKLFNSNHFQERQLKLHNTLNP